MVQLYQSHPTSGTREKSTSLWKRQHHCRDLWELLKFPSLFFLQVKLTAPPVWLLSHRKTSILQRPFYCIALFWCIFSPHSSPVHGLFWQTLGKMHLLKASKHLCCCCVAGRRGKQHDSHKGRLSAMTTFDAATATLIADRYLRQHLNTTAISYTWRSLKGHSSGINIHMHPQTDPWNSCQASFLPVSPVWHLLSIAKVVYRAPTAAGRWAGLLVEPCAHQNALCAGRAAFFWKVYTTCDRELFQKLPSMFCTKTERGLFRAGKKCSSRTRIEVIGLETH